MGCGSYNGGSWDHGKEDPCSIPQSVTVMFRVWVVCWNGLSPYHTSIESWWQVAVPLLASPSYRVLCRAVWPGHSRAALDGQPGNSGSAMPKSCSTYPPGVWHASLKRSQGGVGAWELPACISDRASTSPQPPPLSSPTPVPLAGVPPARLLFLVPQTEADATFLSYMEGVDGAVSTQSPLTGTRL